MQNTPAQELAALRQELEALKCRVTELHRVVEFVPGDPARNEPTTVRLKANCLLLLAPDETSPQAAVVASKEGARLVLCDGAGHTRIQIEATANANIAICTPAGDPVAEIGSDDDSSRGRVLVSDSGNPRAVIKATPDGGCASVLHDDGRPRASLISSAHHGGQLLMITPDLKPGVTISSGAENGGVLSVHNASGRPAVTLVSGKNMSAVIVSNRDGSGTILPN